MKSQRASHQQQPELPAALLSLRNPEDLHWGMQQVMRSAITAMGVSFNKGDEISLTGSKVKHGETDLMLAREVVRGNDTVVLRDEKGNPVWSWRR